MDPVGTSIGAVSLLFQVFSGCVMAYNLLSEAKGLEKHYRYLQIRFRAEQYRLLDWATVAKISEQGDIILINDMNKSVIVNVLDEQYRLMMRFGRLDCRYKPLAQPMISEDYTDVRADTSPENISGTRFPQTNSLLKKALAFADSTTKYPLRLRWVAYDSTKAEELLSRLNSLNSFLHELLNLHEREALKLQEARTHYQIVQMNTKMDQLLGIIEAGFHSLHHDGRLMKGGDRISPTLMMRDLSIGWSKNSEASVEHLVALARFKALTTASDTDILNDGLRCKIGLESQDKNKKSPSLEEADITFDDNDPRFLVAKKRSCAWYYPGGESRRRQRIWIEWNGVAPQRRINAVDGCDPVVVRRFKALVALLQENQRTIQLRAPPCLGYYLWRRSGSNLRCGLAFHNPSHVDQMWQPITLRQCIDCTEGGIPNLTDRVALMRLLTQCVEKLHAVNWLHKGLRSENILFFGPDINQVSISDPFVTGFDFSRPTESASMSESPGLDLTEDLYRHPSVQGRPSEQLRGTGFRKYHDIYSLGLILLEIAYWKPIEMILGFSDVTRLRVLDVLGAQETILGGSYAQWLTSYLGGHISAVIMACIEGPSGLGMSELDEEGGGLGGAKLQERFYEVVVKPLIDIRV